MSRYRIAARYAKSLLELAKEQRKEEQVAKDMRLFEQVCSSNRDFELVLRNPIIKHGKKLNILNRIFDTRVDRITMSIFELTARKNRGPILPAIAVEFQKQYNQQRGVIEASVSTTFKLDEKLQNEFRELIEHVAGEKVELKEKVDPDLIGGFIIQIEDKQMDESIGSKLQHLSLKFKSNTAIKRLTEE